MSISDACCLPFGLTFSSCQISKSPFTSSTCLVTMAVALLVPLASSPANLAISRTFSLAFSLARVFWRHIGRTNQTTGWFLQVFDQSGRILAVTGMWASSSAVIPRRLRDTQFARERCSCARNATTMTASTTFRWVSAKKT